MKLYLLATSIILMSHVAWGDTVFLNSKGHGTHNLQTEEHVLYSDRQTVYKCTNRVTYEGTNIQGIQVTFDSISGNGTSPSPYLLTNCSVQVACDADHYVSGNTCSACQNNSLALSVDESANTAHTNTVCDYCKANYYKFKGACKSCPNGLGADCSSGELICEESYYAADTKDGTGKECVDCPDFISYGYQVYDEEERINESYGTTSTEGATNITQCYMPKESDGSTNTYFDESGKFVLLGDCPAIKPHN